MWDWLLDIESLYRSMVIGAIFTAVIVLAIAIGYVIVKAKKNTKYMFAILHSVMFGVSLSIATVGILNVTRQRVSRSFQIYNHPLNNHLVSWEIPAAIFLIMGSMLVGGGFYFLFRYIKDKMENITGTHPDTSNLDSKTKTKVYSASFFEQVMRRIPIGIIGTLATNPGKSIDGEQFLLLMILIYALPDTILIFLEFYEKHQNIQKALAFSLLGILIHYPLIILDAILSNIFVDFVWWKPIIFSIVASVYIINAFLKFFYEIIQYFKHEHAHHSEREIEGHDHHAAWEDQSTHDHNEEGVSVSTVSDLRGRLVVGTVFGSIILSVAVLSLSFI